MVLAQLWSCEANTGWMLPRFVGAMELVEEPPNENDNEHTDKHPMTEGCFIVKLRCLVHIMTCVGFEPPSSRSCSE